MVKKVFVSKENFFIIQPFIVVTRFFGLCPVNFKQSDGGYILSWSFKYAVYSCCLTIALTIVALVGLTDDMTLIDSNASVRMKDRKSTIILCCDVSAVIMVALYGVLASPFKIKKLWTLLEYCTEIEMMVPQLDYKKYRKRSQVFISCVYSLFTLLLILDISIWSVLSKAHALIYIRNYIGFYGLYYILITHEVYFWHIVYIINIKLILLNEFIRLENVQGPSDSKNNINLYVDSLKSAPSKIGGRSGKFRFNRRYLKNGVLLNRAERIDVMANIYKLITRAVGNLNNDISKGIPLIVLGCLVHLVVTPYFFLIEFMKSDRSDASIVLQAIWILAHVSRFLMIVEPCQKCYTDGQSTSTLVCDLVGLSDTDVDYKKAVSLLNVQVSQKKIKFSCCNLFKIDRSIITTVAGTITTYIVILFQFKTN